MLTLVKCFSLHLIKIIMIFLLYFVHMVKGFGSCPVGVIVRKNKEIMVISIIIVTKGAAGM